MKDISDDKSVANQSDETIAVEEPMVFLRKPLALEVPLAAPILRRTAVAERPSMIARLLDLGGEAFESFHSLAGARQLEAYLNSLAPRLKTELSETMRTERQLTVEDVQRVLRQHDIEFAKVVVEQRTVATRGTFKGRPFEEVMTAKLTQLTMPIGAQVERCADNFGVRRRKHGDHLITLDSESTRGQPLRIVAEVKSRSDNGQRFSFGSVREICEEARMNRGAVACIFVADTADILPDGLPFGQITPCDCFAVFNPDTGDDTALTVALRLSLAAALETVEVSEGSAVDLAAAQKVITDLRHLVDRLGKIESYHSSAKRAIESAGGYLDDLKAQIQTLLRRLDQILGL
jgi:hypothetical protein